MGRVVKACARVGSEGAAAQSGRITNFLAATVLSSALAVASSVAVAGGAPAGSNPAKVEIELNKLETQDDGCRAFFVVGSEDGIDYDAFKVDLVMFQPDGVIGKRFVINLAPRKGSKRSVKQFDLKGVPCDQVGSLLINDVTECTSATGPVENCLGGLTVKSLSSVQLSK